MALDFDKDYFGNDLMDARTPRMFADGTAVYKKLAEEYKLHKTGYFIVAPSGAGKSYFLERQSVNNWMDGDKLWTATNAHPKGEWWHGTEEEIDAIERRSDAVTEEAKRYGFRIIGADHYWGLPDAVVIPEWETHKRYLESRLKSKDDGEYNGGLTSDNLDKVKFMREEMERLGQKGVPIFESFEEATTYLESLE